MKFRLLFVLAVALLVAAAVLWLWPTGGESLPPLGLPATDDPTASTSPSTKPAGRPEATPTPEPPAEPVRVISAVMPGQPMVRSTPAPPVKVAPVPAAAPASAKSVEKEGAHEMEDVRSMFRDFHTRLGENPVGSNAEIMKTIMGGNTAGARLGPPAGQELNGDGELVDRWGTPYFFHQMSKDKMEVRSAGADKQLWTSDDLVTK